MLGREMYSGWNPTLYPYFRNEAVSGSAIAALSRSCATLTTVSARSAVVGRLADGRNPVTPRYAERSWGTESLFAIRRRPNTLVSFETAFAGSAAVCDAGDRTVGT